MTIGFGIVGCGMIANFHAKAIEHIRGAKIVACYDSFASAAQRFAAANNVTGYEQLSDMLADSSVDIVTILAPCVLAQGNASAPALLHASHAVLCISLALLAGITILLHAARKGTLGRNLWRRIISEICGATIVGAVCSLVLVPIAALQPVTPAIAYVTGLGWTTVVDVLRTHVRKFFTAGLRALFQDDSQQTKQPGNDACFKTKVGKP